MRGQAISARTSGSFRAAGRGRVFGRAGFGIQALNHVGSGDEIAAAMSTQSHSFGFHRRFRGYSPFIHGFIRTLTRTHAPRRTVGHEAARFFERGAKNPVIFEAFDQVVRVGDGRGHVRQQIGVLGRLAR